MPSYRLHYFPESGNSYKLALMLTLCGQAFEPVWTDFGGGVTRTAEWRKILDGNGLVFGVVGILDDIPHDKQMIENEVLVPFENDTMMTISSPIWVDGSKKVQPRKPPGLGEHSDEILRNAGYDEAAIQKLRASGAVA